MRRGDIVASLDCAADACGLIAEVKGEAGSTLQADHARADYGLVAVIADNLTVSAVNENTNLRELGGILTNAR